MVRSRLEKFSLVAFVVSFACFAAFDVTSVRSSEFPTLPLPSPSLDARMAIYASVAGQHALWVDLAARNPELSGPPIPCVIDVYKITPNGPVRLAHSTLRVAATYEWGHLTIYSSDSFALPRGKANILVRNEGCADNYVFSGGAMSIHHYSPVVLSFRSLLKYLAYALGAFACAALVYELANPGSRRKGTARA